MIALQAVRNNVITLADDCWQSVEGLSWRDLDANDRALLKRLADVVETESKTPLTVRRNRRHVVGRVNIQHKVFSVPPPITEQDFATLYLFATGGDLSKFIDRRTASQLYRAGDVRSFVELIAILLVEAAEDIISGRVAQAYIQKEARLGSVKERPLWIKDFGRPRGPWIYCRYHELEADNILNRLIYAGLFAARQYLKANSDWYGRCSRQLLAWADFASPFHASQADFDLAHRRLNALTSHYVAALTLARAVLFGFDPDATAERAADVQCLEFSLPSLFESFLYRFFREACAGQSRISFQEAGRECLRDEADLVYRSVKPDIIIYRSGSPIAVVDAKYKPQLVNPARDGSVVRASNADIYQLLFYQKHLQLRSQLSRPPVCLLVAPLLNTDTSSARVVRSIVWKEGTVEEGRIEVVSFPFVSVLRHLREGVKPEMWLRQESLLLPQALRSILAP